MRYTVIKVGKLGSHDPKFGTRYWGRVEESQMEVSFNLLDPVDIPEGAELESEERLIKETKGTPEKPSREYLQLKKVKVFGGKPEVSTSASVSAPGQDRILEELRKQTALLQKLVGDSQEDTVVDLDPEETIDLDQIPGV